MIPGRGSATGALVSAPDRCLPGRSAGAIGHAWKNELAHAVGVAQIESNRAEAPHRVSHKWRASQAVVVHDFREEPCAEFRHVDTPVVERVGKAVSRPVRDIEMEPERQKGQDGSPISRFAKPAVDQNQRRAFADFDDLS